MKGILGCDAPWLQPGAVVFAGDGRQMRVLRKITEEEAMESADRNGLPRPQPVGNEQWYEVDIDLLADVSGN